MTSARRPERHAVPDYLRPAVEVLDAWCPPLAGQLRTEHPTELEQLASDYEALWWGCRVMAELSHLLGAVEAGSVLEDAREQVRAELELAEMS